MKKSLLFVAAIAMAVTVAWAGGAPRLGTLISENSVPCGSQSKGKKKTKTIELDCQEYLIRSGATDYRVREPKPSDKGLIAVNSAVEFTIDKNKMKFKANGHSYEYLLVAESAAGSAAKP